MSSIYVFKVYEKNTDFFELIISMVTGGGNGLIIVLLLAVLDVDLKIKLVPFLILFSTALLIIEYSLQAETFTN